MSFVAAAAIALLAFAANSAASPLYRVYQGELGFSATTLTLLFTVYIVVLLATLLVLGSTSDYVGRRRVMVAGLAVGAAACGLFLVAHGVGLLFGARALQGIAVGLISGTASAALLDLRPDSSITPLISSAAPTAGQALGAIGASALAEYAPAPTHLVWWLLLGAVPHRHPRRAGDARTRKDATRRGERTAAARQRGASGQGRLRCSGAGLGGTVGARGLLPVAGALAGSAAGALAEPALGRDLDLPPHRSRGGSLVGGRQEEPVLR